MSSSKMEKGEIVLILDVQSSVVRGSLVVLKTGVMPEILFSYNADIHYKAHTNSDYLIKTTLKAVSETVKAVEHHINTRKSKISGDRIHGKISVIHFALSSPWIVSQARTIKMNFPKTTRVTRSYILDLIKTERDKLADSKNKDLTVIEEKIFDVRLNGYSVDTWEGRETKDLEIIFAVSVAGVGMIEGFVKECSTVVSDKRIHFHSSLLLQYMGLQTIFPANDNYGLIHVHGELTDCVIIKNHSCSFFSSIQNGIRTLVRKIASDSKTDEHAADSLIALYTGGQLDASHSRESTEIIKKSSEIWLGDLNKTFLEAQNESSIPTSFILSAYAHDDFYVKILTQAYPTTQVRALSIDDIVRWVSFGDGVERRRLSGLYALALSNYVI